MTDDRLDEILKQSLAQEITEYDIFQYRKARERKIMLVRKRLGIGTAAAAAALAAAIGTIGIVDPALASKIPLIGSIFSETQDQVTFSGDYSEKATILEGQETAETADTLILSAQDQGFVMTASEIYSDGYSIYLTLQVEAAEEDFSYIPEIYTQPDAEDPGDKLAAVMYSNIEYEMDGAKLNQVADRSMHIEGMVADVHTFAGMVKIDLPEQLADDGILQLHVTGIGYDDTRPEMQNNTTEKAAHWFDGNWDLEIPVTVDPDVKVITLDETTGDYTLKTVMVSDFQVVVDTQIPTLPQLSVEEITGLLEEHPEITDDLGLYDYYGIPCVICDTYVFDQNGELLTPVSEINGLARFAVQGKELSELHVYIFDNWDYGMDIYKGRMDETEASQLAVISREVVLE